MIARIINFLQTTKVQVFSIVFAAAYITILLLMTYQKHTFCEEIVHLAEPSATAQELASNVEVGLHFNSFPHFSVKNTTFTFDGIAWFKYDKGGESIETLESFNIKKMITHSSKLFYKSPPIVKVMGDKVLVSYHVQATFMTEIAFKKFPIGDHRINLYLENKEASTNELLFSIKPENITFSETLLVDSWKPVAKHTSSGIVQASIGGKKSVSTISYPSIGVSLDFRNIGIRGLISLYFPLFILFFIGLLSLTIGIFNTARLSIIGSAFPTLVLFRFVIDAVSPDIGYTTHIDFIYYLLVALSFLILFFQTHVIVLIDRAKASTEKNSSALSKKRFELYNCLLFQGIIIALLTILTYNFFH